MRDFFLKMKEKIWLILAVFTFVAFLFSLIYSFFNPLFFQAKARVLIVQHLRPDFDALATLQAQERLARNFRVFIESQSFMNKVLIANTNIWDTFGNEVHDRLKKWQETIKGRATPEGVLEIKSKSSDPDQAWQIASGITFVLFEHGKDYHGGGDLVTFQLLDSPQVSDAFWATFSLYFPRILGLAFIAWLLIYLISFPWKSKHPFHVPDMKIEEKEWPPLLSREKKEERGLASIKAEMPPIYSSEKEGKIFTLEEAETKPSHSSREELKGDGIETKKKESNLQEPKFWLDQFLQEQQKETFASNNVSSKTSPLKNKKDYPQPRRHLRAGAEILYERSPKTDLYDIANGRKGFV